MNSEKLYYQAPPEEQFEDMKREAIKLWHELFNEKDRNKKIEKIIRDAENITDNFMSILGIFRPPHQAKLVKRLNFKTRQEIKDRLSEGHIDADFDYIKYYVLNKEG